MLSAEDIEVPVKLSPPLNEVDVVDVDKEVEEMAVWRSGAARYTRSRISVPSAWIEAVSGSAAARGSGVEDMH